MKLPTINLNFTLRAKALLASISLGILVFLILSAGLPSVNTSIRNQMISNRLALAESKAEEINQFLAERYQHIIALASDPVLQEKDTVKKSEFFKSIQNSYKDYSNLLILDSDGKVLVAASENSINWKENPGFQKAQTKNKPSLSSVFLDPEQKSAFIAFFAPVSHSADILVLQVSTASLTKIIENIRLEKTSSALVIDENNKIIINRNKEILLSSFPNEITESFDSSRKGIMKVNLGAYENMVTLFAILPGDLGFGTQDWRVIINQQKSEFAEATSNFWLYFVLITVLLTAITFLVNSLGVREATEIIKKIMNGLKGITDGNLNYELELPSSGETKGLASSFKEMTEKVKDSYSQLEEKIAEKTKELTKSLDSFKEHAQKLEDRKKAMLNVLEDVKEEQEKTAEEKNKIQTLLDSIGDAVFAVDTKKEIFLFNKACEDMSEYTFSEATGKVFTEILHFVKEEDGATVEIPIDDVLKTGTIETKGGEKILIITKAERKIPIAYSIAPIKDINEDILGAILVLHDMTKDYEAEKMKAEFVSLASHQLRTPLTSLKWYLEMTVNGDAGVISDKGKEYLNRAIISSERMVTLINQLLNVSRIESGRIGITTKPQNLIEVTKAVLDEFIPMLEERKQQLIFHEPERNIENFLLDRAIFHEILQNLVSNAIKYSPPETGIIEIALQVNDQNVIWTVKDNGYGIPKESQEKLFSKFYRAENILTKDHTGSGLGLYVVKRLVEDAGGKLEFSSEENKGSTFSIVLPLSGMKEKKGEKSVGAVS